MPWTPTSWQSFPQSQEIHYPDAQQLASAVAQLATLPPLVTSWEVERLKHQLAEAEQGKRFILQGGDCAENFADCTPSAITNKLKILLQMSLVLVHGLKRPVVRIGRMAGQYAKPRSSATETRALPPPSLPGKGPGEGFPAAHTSEHANEQAREQRGGLSSPQSPVASRPPTSQSLPSYFGDLINRPAFDPASRTPDPQLLLEGYTRAALTMNFVRALVEGGFADIHHPEYWDMSFLSKAGLPPHLREQYKDMSEKLADGLRFMEALGEKAVDDLTRVEFFSSHEGLSLWYESAQTRTVPRREGFYNLASHLPWIGERTRSLTGAHVHFFSGVRNPVGVKVSAHASPADLLALSETLNPTNEPGKLVFITRLGAHNVERTLPQLLTTLARAQRRCAWICDPMHANTRTLTSGPSAGKKTRSFDDILSELTATHATHQRLGIPLAGVHFELTADDVTECTGGAGGISESDLPTNYTTTCDPRLNYHQALEMAFVVARLYA